MTSSEPTAAEPASAITFEETIQLLLNEALTTIGATGGSVMLVDAEHDSLVIQARLGPPRAGTLHLPRFKVDDHSVAGHVASTGRHHRSGDVSQDSFFSAPRSGQLTFRSLLCIPILTGARVIGVINADHGSTDYFTDGDEQRLSKLASRLSRAVTERQRSSRILESLHSVGAELASLNRGDRLADALQKIADQAMQTLGADIVTLYQYDAAKELFLVEGTGPTIAGELRYSAAPMRDRVFSSDVPARIVKGGYSRYFWDMTSDRHFTGDVPAREGQQARPRFALREGIKSMAALLLRANTEIVGVMFANYRSLHNFAEDEKRILETFANYAAIAIRNTRLLEGLQVAQEQRLAVERWVTLGQAVTNIAHRINNTAALVPVSVQSVKELLGEITMDPQIRTQIDGDLRRIHSSTSLAVNMASVLLKPFAEGPARQIDLHDLIEEAIASLMVPSGISIHVSEASELPSMEASPLLLEVFVELIANALKAMSEGGTLTIRSRAVPGDQVEVRVQDSGIGIPRQRHQDVFSLFFTTGKESLGFGLWWVKTFLLQQGGTIELESELGYGTTFTLRLPVRHYGQPSLI